MSIRYSEKCSKETAKQFLLEVKEWCDKNKIPYKKIRGLTAYEGEVRIYNGKKVFHIPLRRSKKLVAFKNTKGEWEGDLEAVELHGGKGDSLYVLGYHPRQEIMYTSVFRDEWNNKKHIKGEQNAIKNFFRMEAK